MKKAAIIYFSGTGNTKFVVDIMKSELEKRAIVTDLINIEKDTIIPYNYEFIIIGGPIYVDLYPKRLVNYLKVNLKNYSKNCMLFSTQASNKPTCAFQQVINKLQFIKVSYCEFITMPNNFYNFMFKETSKEEQGQMIKGSIMKTRQAINDFIQGKTKMYHKNFVEVELVNAVYKMFYPYIAKVFTKKITVDFEKCSQCKLCENQCPNKCIKIKDKVVIDNKCMLCERCMNNCPRNAFLYKNKEYKKYLPNFRVYKD